MGCKFHMNPAAIKSVVKTPYNYSFNNPTCPPEPWRRRITFADPSGADPDPEYQNPNHQNYFHNGAGSAGYPGLTYDDVVPQSARGEFNSAFGWRQDTMLGWFAGGGNMGAYWHPGDGRMFWSGYESYARGLRHDADAVRFGHMSLEDYGSRNGTSISVDQLRYMAYAHNHGVNPVTGVSYNSSASSNWYSGSRYTSSKTGITYSERKGTIAGNALRILGSLFAVGKEKTLVGKAIQLLSRFTWELPQQALGVIAAEVVNVAGGIKNSYFNGGALVLESKFLGPEAGYTLGNLLTVGVGTSLETIAHEFGHYVQGRILGPLYLPVIALPSSVRASALSLDWSFGLGWFNNVNYDDFYTESWATRLGQKYWAPK
jgi:hypothetical protein